MVGKVGEDVGLEGGRWDMGKLEAAGVGGADCAAVGELDADGLEGGCLVLARCVAEEVVSGGSGVKDGVVVRGAGRR